MMNKKIKIGIKTWILPNGLNHGVWQVEYMYTVQSSLFILS